MKSSFIRALPIVAKALSENYGVRLDICGNQAMATMGSALMKLFFIHHLR